MRRRRLLFTMRTMMIAVAIVAVILAVEAILFHAAVQLVKSHDDYLWNEAVTVWGILNLALIIPSAVAVCARAAMGDQAESQQRNG